MKTYLCLLLAFVLAALPTMGQTQQTVTISVPVVFGEVQIPSGFAGGRLVDFAES